MSVRIYGDRPLKTLPGQLTRPTSARVREAVFNIWKGAIDGCRWLDLCAGSGAMSAEALCRGAASITAIEQSGRACAMIRENLEAVAQESQTFQVMRADVTRRLKKLQGQQFDRIYFDPPYASDLYSPTLEAIAGYLLLAPDGELALEHSSDREPFAPVPSLEICRQKAYGGTAITFYRLVRG
ncbi:MAG: 16S rRNA (guanine(966)-N(2))-methyltransferase RsmD [Oscillatoria sp. SIO1A7]|nr:16S rRNA (guanine(966)-N(2))-methyltransferase RsmD [Oscillatoria sp. SIO1A7]